MGEKRKLAGALVAVLFGIGLCACSSASPAASVPPPRYAVGIHSEQLVDISRSTPPDGAVAGHAGRTLMLTVFYPALGKPGGPTGRDTAPDRAGAPYPLIVFAHGFGSDPGAYETLLVDWAATGYVVGAPTFPLTSASAPGGPDLADYVNQPGDVSFVVSELRSESQRTSGLLSGLVDEGEIGVAGHSLGGVTTLGLVANTCCQDRRVKVAAVLSGDPIGFPGGTVMYPAMPLLFVHGDADQVVPYAASVAAFDDAHIPKGLVTIEGGDHSSPVDPHGAAFASVVRATTDFFDRYLKGDQQAARRLQSDGRPGATRLALALSPGSRLRLAVPRPPKGQRHASITPSAGLTDGQRVIVSWRGYQPGVTVNILECSTPVSGAQACNLATAAVGEPDPVGTGTVSFVVHTGAVGSGVCDAGHPCVVVVNEGGSSSPSSSVLLPISFVP